MSGESHEIVPLLRYLENLRRSEAVCLADEFEAAALADSWNEQNPDSLAIVTNLLDGRYVVSVEP
jgi:hypothetical protein